MSLDYFVSQFSNSIVIIWILTTILLMLIGFFGIGYIVANKDIKTSISIKMISTIFCVLICFGCLSFYSFRLSFLTARDVKVISQVYIPTLQAVSEITEMQLKQRIRFNKYLRDRDQVQFKEFMNFSFQVNELLQSLEKSIVEATKNSQIYFLPEKSSAILAHLNIVKLKHKIYDDVCLSAIIKESESLEYKNLLRQCDSSAKDVSETVISMRNIIEIFLNQVVTRIGQTETKSQNSFVINVLLGLIFSIMISVGLKNIVSRTKRQENQTDYQIKEIENLVSLDLKRKERKKA